MTLHREITAIYLKTRESVAAYAADMAVAAGYCGQCGRRHTDVHRTCWTCRKRNQRAKNQEKK